MLSSLKTRFVALSSALSLILLLTVSPVAHAVINGTADGNRHPNTAFVYLQSVYCSGVLISQRYVATAAHCIVSLQNGGGTAADVQVSFNEDPYATGSTWYQAKSVSLDPKYLTSMTNNGGPAVNDSPVAAPANDYGLIELVNPVVGITPANLPALNASASILQGKVAMQGVGYGTVGYLNGSGVRSFTRHYTDLTLSNSSGHATISDVFLKLNGKQTGLCFGDSGGPTFLGSDTSTVYGLFSSFASNRCEGWSFVSRMDIPDAHAFYDVYDF